MPQPPPIDARPDPDGGASPDLQRVERVTQPVRLPAPSRPTVVGQGSPSQPTRPGGFAPVPGVLPDKPHQATAVLPPPRPEPAHASAEVPRAPDTTAVLPPDAAPAALVTAVLAPDPQSSRLAAVPQRSAPIEPEAKDSAWERPQAEISHQPSRSTPRKRPVHTPSSPREAASRSSLLQAIDLRVVVISAAVLLVLGAVVLLGRSDPGRSFEKEAPPHAAIPGGPRPGPGARAPAPRIPTAEASAAEPALVTAGSNSDQPGAENAAQDRRIGDGARQASPVEADGPDKTGGRSRRRW
jgi:translation initiation factor IF-2